MDIESELLFGRGRESPRELLLKKWRPRSSLCIGIVSFLFQVTVLYPWHLRLSKEFEALAFIVRNITCPG